MHNSIEIERRLFVSYDADAGLLVPVVYPNDTRKPCRAAASAGGAVSSELRMVAVQLPVGTVRVSLGAYSRFEDVHAFVAFLYGAFEDERGMRLVAASSHHRRSWISLWTCIAKSISMPR